MSEKCIGINGGHELTGSVDVQGAKNAGWGAIHLAKPGMPHSGADYMVQSLDEVPALL